MLFQQKSNITPHSTPVPGQESATIKTIVPIKDSAAAPSAHVPKISIKDALVEILKLNHELQARKKDAVKTTEIEAYSLRVWKAHVAGDKRIRQLKDEIKMIENQSHKMWDHFQLVLTPAMLTSEDMMPIYEQLVNVYQGLKHLKDHESPVSPNFAARLVSLQNQLHSIEDNRLPLINAIAPPENVSGENIPFGQAVISTLLNRCYKLAHTLACEERPIEPPSRLLDINDSLLALLNALESGYQFDPILLRLLAEELHEIEVCKVNGVFVEQDGSLALNQVLIKRDIDMAHELINEILLYMDPKVSMIPSSMKRDDDRIHKVYQAVKQARDEMQCHIDDGGSGASFDFKPVMQPIQDALNYLEEGVETTVESARFLLSSAVQSAFRLASHLADTVAPVDPSLQPLYERIQAVFERLQAVKRAQNWEKIQSHGHEYGSHEKELEECDRELQECRKWKNAGLWIDEIGNQNDDDIFSQDALDLAYNKASHLLQELLFQKNLKV